MVNIYNGILLSAIKNNEILSFSTIKMDLKGITLSKMSDRDKYHMLSLCVESKNKTK